MNLAPEERTSCFLAPIIDKILAQRVNGYGLRSCDGQLDPHHCVEQQRLKKKWEPGLGLEYVLADQRNIVPVCRKHHDLLTSHAIKLAEADYPPSVHEFAADYGFHFDERQGWVAAFACDGIDEAAYRDLA